MHRRLLTLLLPALVGLAALAISAVLVSHEAEIERRALRSAFDLGLRQTASRIEQRIASYELVLRGAQGLFHATGGRVTAADFASYVHAQLGGADAAGMQGIAYVAAPGDDGRATLRFSAPAPATPARLLGFDFLAEPVRRDALLQARDSGGVAVSRKLRLVPDGEGASSSSFLMVLPVYGPGEPPADLAQRRQRHAGWVIAAFRMNDLMASLYGEGMPGLALRVHDGVRLDAEALMYDSANAAAPPATPPRHEAHEYIGFAGHTWTLTVHTLPEFEALHAPDTPRIILGAGLVASLLLSLLTYQLVSGRERAHAVAQAMTRELRESEERYRRIVETADEGIWMLDAQGRTSFVNPKVLALLGHPQQALLSQPLGRFLDEPGRVLVERFLARGAAAAAEHHELRFRRADGADLWASLTMSAVTDAAGRYAGTLAMVTDISAAKQAEARRQLLEAQLRESQKMEAVGTLAGGIAHDFNNIVAAILGNAALARDALPADAPAAAHLSQILLAGDHARSLVQQIVAFSRRQPLARVAQPLAPLVEAAARLLRATLPAGVELRTALSEQPVWAQVDANQLQQVLMNLGTNAWHALAGGAGRIELGLTSTPLDDDAVQSIGGLRPGRHAHLWVLDNGIGMDEATVARIFEPFFTTKPVGQGTGLGLSVVHGIVAAHQGAIVVASRPGEGTRFDLYFPLAEGDRAPATPHAPADGAAQRGRGERLLYVDDDAVMVMTVEALLERAGYRVRAFVDARAALEALRAEPEAFDLVITDYNMPELSGLDVVRALRFIRPTLPVIISSGYLSEDIRAAAKDAGVRHLLQKEYSTERLVPLVQQVLEETRAA
ncbi:CHASE domain-containing protein [Aquabacterium humicola]|uniref:CHASE domain-containing protein n=1 Tax=Aquabacterium humicola TaxID=3237377 RepID=UPI00254389F0|nr:CHASE domain-containing protein [Rubrivivax pictus]